MKVLFWLGFGSRRGASKPRLGLKGPVNILNEVHGQPSLSPKRGMLRKQIMFGLKITSYTTSTEMTVHRMTFDVL